MNEDVSPIQQMGDFPASHVSELGGVSNGFVFESLGCFSPICWHVNWVEIRVALPETDSLPLKIGGLSRHFIFQPLIFMGELLVWEGRVHDDVDGSAVGKETQPENVLPALNMFWVIIVQNVFFAQATTNRTLSCI